MNLESTIELPSRVLTSVSDVMRNRNVEVLELVGDLSFSSSQPIPQRHCQVRPILRFRCVFICHDSSRFEWWCPRHDAVASTQSSSNDLPNECFRNIRNTQSGLLFSKSRVLVQVEKTPAITRRDGSDRRMMPIEAVSLLLRRQNDRVDDVDHAVLGDNVSLDHLGIVHTHRAVFHSDGDL